MDFTNLFSTVVRGMRFISKQHTTLILLTFMLLSPAAALAGWVSACDGQVPAGAEPQGYEASGESLWIARARLTTRGQYSGVHPGKMRPGFHAANIPWGGREIIAKCYDVWVGPGYWVPASGGNVPNCAMAGGEESNGEPLYIARGMIKGGLHIGKVRPGFNGANISYGGKELTVRNYEVLCR